MAHHVIEFDQRCRSCKGTGLYVGIAERDGSAVVCHTCRGTGCEHTTIEYDDFEGREMRAGVVRVYEVNPGIVIGRGPDGQYRLEDFGGQPFASWWNHAPFGHGSENRRFTCPAWWYQTADYKRKPEWSGCVGVVAFSRCPHFADKHTCWQRFDAEASR
jgi:hypothetical protein